MNKRSELRIGFLSSTKWEEGSNSWSPTNSYTAEETWSVEERIWYWRGKHMEEINNM